MFKRKRSDGSEASEDQVEAVVVVQTPVVEPPANRSEGPWDISELTDDGVQRLDFGSLQIPGVEGMDINLEVDEDTQAVVAITIILGEGGLQLQPFAAPRSGDFWPEVREELERSIIESGGVVEPMDGVFGAELAASVPAVDEQGQPALQQVRFIGIEGPRWLLRAVMLGQAAVDPRAAEVFEDVLRGCVLTRGNQPMAPGDMLPLRLPADAVAEDDDDDDDDGPDLNPFERGPEITEIR